jgi:hypothetical protein
LYERQLQALARGEALFEQQPFVQIAEIGVGVPEDQAQPELSGCHTFLRGLVGLTKAGLLTGMATEVVLRPYQSFQL